MSYRFKSKDDSHGGRRILVDTAGGGPGQLLQPDHEALDQTLVTIRMDWPGGALGGLVNSAGLAQALESGLARMLENIAASIPKA